MFLEHTLTWFWLSGLLFAVALTAMHLRAPAWEAAAVVLFSVYRTGLGMEPRGSAARESRGPGVENAVLRAARTISLQKIPDPRRK